MRKQSVYEIARVQMVNALKTADADNVNDPSFIISHVRTLTSSTNPKAACRAIRSVTGRLTQAQVQAIASSKDLHPDVRETALGLVRV